MAQSSTATHVKTWLRSLGVLTTVSKDSDEVALIVETFAPLLAERFPAAAFCPASLEAVASLCDRGFPTYGELVPRLSGWWAANRPPPRPLASARFLEAPPPERRAEPTPEELAAVTRTVAELRAFLHSPDAEHPPSRPEARHLSPELLDAISPLPNGRKRSHAPAHTRDA